MSGVLKGMFFAAFASMAMFAVGCGDVCEDAADICGGGDTGADSDGECSGATECASQCIVDEDSCDFTNEALASCFQGCGTAG